MRRKEEGPKIAIVNSSELGACWLPKRFVGDCHECERVEKCKLPEARKARDLLRKREQREKARKAVQALLDLPPSILKEVNAKKRLEGKL